MILAQGGRFGGWSLYSRTASRPTHTTGWACNATPWPPTRRCLPARHLRFEFAYDGGEPGAGGIGRISLDGTQIAEGRIARTHPFAFSADEGADVGEDLATPVTDEYQVPAKFPGTIKKITVEVQPIAVADRPAVNNTAIVGLERRAEFE